MIIQLLLVEHYYLDGFMINLKILIYIMKMNLLMKKKDQYYIYLVGQFLIEHIKFILLKVMEDIILFKLTLMLQLFIMKKL